MSPEEWKRHLEGRRPASPDVPVIAAIVHAESFTRSVPTVGNSSGAFRVRDQNGADWVAKSLDNGQSNRSTVTDALIGAVALLIDAPTCSTSILEYPQGQPAHELAPGVLVAPGYLHGSRLIPRKREHRNVEFITDDNNLRRWAGVAALYDWCWGVDHQWLFDLDADYQLYSHDHGLYLHGEAGHWTVDDLKARVAEPRTLPQLQGVLPQALEHCESYAEALRDVTREGIADALSTIPAQWPVSLDELAHLAWFLAERREPVARRLERAWN